MYWAQALAEQSEDAELRAYFRSLAKTLTENEEWIVAKCSRYRGIRWISAVTSTPTRKRPSARCAPAKPLTRRSPPAADAALHGYRLKVSVKPGEVQSVPYILNLALWIDPKEDLPKQESRPKNSRLYRAINYYHQVPQSNLRPGGNHLLSTYC